MKVLFCFLLLITFQRSHAQKYSISERFPDDTLQSTAKKDNYFNENPYDLTLKKELIIAVPITAVFLADIYIDPRPFTEEDLLQLNINDIPWFERNLIYFDTIIAARADAMSDIFNKSALLLGLSSTLIPICDFSEIFTNFIIYYEGVMINSGLTDLLKKSVGRVRPYVYNTSFPDAYRLNGAVNSSFPSGHTSSSAFSCFFAAKMIDDYLIDDNNRILKTINWTSAALIPAWVGYLRMAAGVHFLTDVAGGFIIGASCGYFIPALHKVKNENISFSPVYWNEGSGMQCLIKF